MCYSCLYQRVKEVEIMKLFKTMLAVIVIVCFASSFSFADDLTKDGPCRADIQKFCKSVRPGKGKLLRCMRQYSRHLSEACTDHIGVVKEKTGLFKKACKKDIGRFCADVEKTPGAIFRCLEENHASLSAVCANQVK